MLTNASFLYFRVVVNTILVLLGTRYVLAALGVIDFGIYAVVGGVMLFLGFLTSAMSVSSERHLAHELGRGDYQKLNLMFNCSFGLHLALALLTLILAESIGLWFLVDVMNIPADRESAAFWVYQFTVIATFCSVVSIPFQALFSAHEDLIYVAIIGIVQSIMNFLLALWIVEYDGDRLIVYSGLASTIIIAVILFQVTLSRSRYIESQIDFHKFYDASLTREMASFAGWNLIGSFAVVTRFQGLAFLMNIYFGAAVNASLAIANQVYSSVGQMTQSVLQAVSPNLTKHEGAGNREHAVKLALLTCKYSFILACFWALPLLFEMEYVLRIWLDMPPSDAVYFCQIVVLSYMANQLSNGLTMAVQAIGKIAFFQSLGSFIHISTLPLAWGGIILGGDESIVMVVALVTMVLNALLRAYLLGRITEFSYFRWLRDVVLRGVLVVFPAISILVIGEFYFQGGLDRLIMLSMISSVSIIVAMYFVGMDGLERQWLSGKVKSLFIRIHNRV